MLLLGHSGRVDAGGAFLSVKKSLLGPRKHWAPHSKPPPLIMAGHRGCVSGRAKGEVPPCSAPRSDGANVRLPLPRSQVLLFSARSAPCGRGCQVHRSERVRGGDRLPRPSGYHHGPKAQKEWARQRRIRKQKGGIRQAPWQAL